MDDSKNFYLEIPALRVNQPLGDFYIIKISAQQLLDLSFSEPMAYKDELGNVKGSQRPKDEKRLKDIAKYIDSVEMAFPNSIILAANYTPNEFITKDDSERWQIIEETNCGIYKICIPKKVKLAAIIDGQHRVNAFEYVQKSERFTDLQLICSVYFDIPNSYQAFLFATINSNQKKVDRSLALEQFGYNVGEEQEKSWTPEKLGVFISRKLNIDQNSAFHKHIKVAPLNPENLFKNGLAASWVVSTATVVDGIVSLISSNPKKDRIAMQQKHVFSGRSRDMIQERKDYSPLRKLFINGRDQDIYNTILNYFTIVDQLFWQNPKEKSYIIKTVGVQALFDVLKIILNSENLDNPQNTDFRKILAEASHIDFSDKFFQASGIGRSRIKNSLAVAAGLIKKEKLKKTDLSFYEDVLAGRSTPTEKDKWPWEEEAENAVINALEKAEWNFTSKSVNLFLDSDYENSKSITDYSSLFSKLVEIAEIAYASALPSDQEFADEQRENFDPEDLVNSHLNDYVKDLTKLNWISQ